MSNIETVFGANGSMKNKAIHVGTVRAYNRLFVEDEAYFSSNVGVDGTIEAKGGVKIGNTVLTEALLNKSTTGVEGVVDTFEEPSSKKLKMDSDGVTLKHEYKSVGKFLKANAVASQNQIVTPTGFLAENDDSGTTKQSFMLPGIVGTDDLHVTNLHARKHTQGGSIPNEINIPTAKLNVTEIGSTTGSTVISSSSLVIDGTINGSGTEGVKIGDATVSGDLTVSGKTELQGNVVIATDVTIPTLTVTKQLITQGTVTGGTSTSFDKISVNQIETNTNGTVTLLSPVQNMQILEETEDVKWDSTNDIFYKVLDYNLTKDDNYDHYFGKLTDAQQIDVIENFFGVMVDTTKAEAVQQVEQMMSYLKFSGFMCSPLTNDFNHARGKVFTNISPLTEYEFYGDLDTSTDPVLKAKYSMYKDFRKGNDIGKFFADKCKADSNYYDKFGKLLIYLRNKNYHIDGISGITGNGNYLSIVFTDGFCKYKQLLITVNANSASIQAIYAGGTQSEGLRNSNPFYNAEDEIFKNIVEFLVKGIYMSLIIQGTKPSFKMKKSGNIFPHFDSPPPFALSNDNFLLMLEYIDAWKNSTFWDDMKNIVDDTISRAAEQNTAYDFIDQIITADPNKDSNDAIRETFIPAWYEPESTGATSDDSVVLEHIRTPTSYIMQVKTKGMKYTCPYSFNREMQINRLTGSTTIDGTLHVDNITSNTSNTIQMGNTNFTALSINGNKIVPSSTNVEADMKFVTNSAKVYVNKCKAGKHTAEDTLPGTGTKVPEVYIDINYTGCVYYVTIRPFFIVSTELINKFAPTTSTGTGGGCIILPFDNKNGTDIVTLNPYGFPIMDSRDSSSDDILSKGTMTVDQSTTPPTYDVGLYRSNKYAVAKTSFTWVKYVVDKTNPNKPAYSEVVWDYGTITYYVTGECGECVNMHWQWENDGNAQTNKYLGNYAKSFDPGAGCSLDNEYIVVGGATFTILRQNKSENYGFYSERS